MVGGSDDQLRPYGSRLMDLTSSSSPLGSENSNKSNNSPRTSGIGGAYGNKREKNKSNWISRDLERGEINVARKYKCLSKISMKVIFTKVRWRRMLGIYHLESL